ncbi:MAG: pantoate--beta-alanine ligase [Balneolaceae bacterium]
MLVTDSIGELRSAVRLWKREKLKVGFVPTMGALHEGHLALIREAKKQAGRVVVSIYVNPFQFAPGEDYEEYPRDLAKDLLLCRNAGAAAVFTPDNELMYPGESYLTVEIEELSEEMCGRSRPGFFNGVVRVVNKFFNIVEPDVAVFGQKDLQQYRIIEQMVREFNHGIRLICAGIVREDDGLACSSRNLYLSDEQRRLAPSLYRSLLYITEQIEGGVYKPGLLISHQRSELEAKGFQIDYLGTYSYDLLQPADILEKGHKYLLAGAVWLGETRLIDNMILTDELTREKARPSGKRAKIFRR